jgi:hypothetical protein
MMAALRVNYPIFKAFTSSGSFAVGYKVYTYEAGTTTPLTTYQDSGATTPHANPIVLNSLGEAEIFITEPAKFTLTDADDNVQTGWPIDNIDPTTITASEVSYDNSTSGMTASNVQDAIDENSAAIAAIDTNSGITRTVPTGSRLTGGIFGLGYSQDTDSDHDISFDIGSCLDSTGSEELRNTAAMVKQIDATWAVGDAAGGMFDGASLSANTPYALFIIKKTSDNSIDFGFDDNIDGTNVPSGYGKFRCIGTVTTDSSSNIIDFDYGKGVLTYKKASEVSINSSGAVPAAYTAVSLTAYVISTDLIDSITIGGQASAGDQDIAISYDGTNTYTYFSATNENNLDTQAECWSGGGNQVTSTVKIPITSTDIYWGLGGNPAVSSSNLLMHRLFLNI